MPQDAAFIYPLGEFEQFFQPILFGFGPNGDGRRAIAADDHAAHRDADDIHKQVAAVALMTRVGQYGKVLHDGT